MLHTRWGTFTGGVHAWTVIYCWVRRFWLDEFCIGYIWRNYVLVMMLTRMDVVWAWFCCEVVVLGNGSLGCMINAIESFGRTCNMLLLWLCTAEYMQWWFGGVYSLCCFLYCIIMVLRYHYDTESTPNQCVKHRDSSRIWTNPQRKMEAARFLFKKIVPLRAKIQNVW